MLGPSGAGQVHPGRARAAGGGAAIGPGLLGGVDIGRLAAGGRPHARIAWLAQATTYSMDTIRANLLLARPGRAMTPALWAARRRRVSARSRRTARRARYLGWRKRGAGLSGGQARRLALARAAARRHKRPRSILDEPAYRDSTAGAPSAPSSATVWTEFAAGRTVGLRAPAVRVERLDRIWRLSGGRAVSRCRMTVPRPRFYSSASPPQC